MTTQDLTKMLVFLLGLWLVPSALSGILSLPLYAENLTAFYDDPSDFVDRSFFNGALILASLNLVFVVSFLAVPGWWARLVFSGNRNVELPRLREQAFQGLLFSVVGLTLLVFAVTDTPRVVVEWRLQPEAITPEESRQQFLQYLPDRASLVVRFVIGGWLLLGTNGIVRFVRRMRAAGRDRQAD